MGVTKRKADVLDSKAPCDALEWLVTFLNFGRGRPDVPVQSLWRRRYGTATPFPTLHVSLLGADGIREVTNLQDTIGGRYLSPLIDGPSDTADTAAFYQDALESLANRLGEVAQKPHWIASREAGLNGNFRVGKVSWTIANMSFPDTLEGLVYDAIADTLERGDLSKLRRCDRCSLVFVSSRNWQKACASCKTERDRENNRLRQQRSRARKVQEEEQKKQLLAALRIKEMRRKRIEGFNHFMELARKSKHTTPERAVLSPILKQLGGGNSQKGWRIVDSWIKDGVSWQALSKEYRTVFDRGTSSRG